MKKATNSLMKVVSSAILIFCIACLNGNVSAQSLSTTYASIKTEIADSLTLVSLSADDDALVDSLMQNSPVSVIVFISVSDTALVNNIHLTVGRTLGTSNIANATIPYMGVACPAGMTKRREPEGIYINLGTFSNITNLYLEAWATDINGNSTTTIQTTLN